MLEPKARNELDAVDVLAKRDAAVKWCELATDHAASYGGKPWQYVLIPHDIIFENMTLDVPAKSCAGTMISEGTVIAIRSLIQLVHIAFSLPSPVFNT